VRKKKKKRRRKRDGRQLLIRKPSTPPRQPFSSKLHSRPRSSFLPLHPHSAFRTSSSRIPSPADNCRDSSHSFSSSSYESGLHWRCGRCGYRWWEIPTASNSARFPSGSHVGSANPLHFSRRPRTLLQTTTASTSHPSSPSMITGSGGGIIYPGNASSAAAWSNDTGKVRYF
jgi:hypothetical protein